MSNNIGMNNEQGTERTFTQEEVNRIVQDRLNRSKNTTEATKLEEREKELEKKGLMLEAKELLQKKGLPKEFAEILNYTDSKSLEEAVEVIEGHFKTSSEQRDAEFIPLGGNELPKGAKTPLSQDGMRKAFGLG